MAEKTDVEKIVEELRAMGYDARLLSGETVTLPFYENYVPCGVPNDVGDVVESTITINSELVEHLIGAKELIRIGNSIKVKTT